MGFWACFISGVEDGAGGRSAPSPPGKEPGQDTLSRCWFWTADEGCYCVHSTSLIHVQLLSDGSTQGLAQLMRGEGQESNRAA